MDILVFVKQVPDDSVEIHLDGAGVPAVKDIEKVTNAFDTYALELAARYTEAMAVRLPWQPLALRTAPA